VNESICETALFIAPIQRATIQLAMLKLKPRKTWKTWTFLFSRYLESQDIEIVGQDDYSDYDLPSLHPSVKRTSRREDATSRLLIAPRMRARSAEINTRVPVSLRRGATVHFRDIIRRNVCGHLVPPCEI